MKEQLALRLQAIRKQRGLTQKKMAEFLAIPRSTYVHYELGWRSPDLEMLLLLSEKLGVSLDYLAGRSDFPLTVETALKFQLFSQTQPIDYADIFLYTLTSPTGESVAEETPDT